MGEHRPCRTQRDRHCRFRLNRFTPPIDHHEQGQRIPPNEFHIPETLFGRRSTLTQLVTAYEEVSDRGVTELVLVSGPSGIGKSAVVGELLRQVTLAGGVFAVGKCEQSSSDIPYSTLTAALGRFLLAISEGGEGTLARWRPRLADAVGPNGQILVALIPELEMIIGRQPDAAPLPALEARHRFYFVFGRFLRALADTSRPLALFIDDLQWIDEATVDLLTSVLVDAETKCFLLLGSYRANEVSEAHPLTGLIRKSMAAGTRVREIVLAPLRIDDIEELLAASLRAGRSEDLRGLAEVVRDLGAGSPFLSKQLIAALAESGQLSFEPDSAAWTWDAETIRAGHTMDTISGLISARLVRLPEAAQGIVKTLSCLGNGTDAATLAMLLGVTEHDVHAALSDVLGKGLLQRAGGRYAFAHDKMQEAAYGLIPESARAAMHLRIGRAFVNAFDDTRMTEKLFEVVNQLNRGIEDVVDPDERLTIARLNLAAAKRAKTATAYASLHAYIGFGLTLLPLDGWTTHPRLMFEFEFNFCEGEFLRGHLHDAELRLMRLATRDITLAERSTVTWLQITLLTAAGQLERAVGECLSFLEKVGIHWVPHPDLAAIRQEYAPILREIEQESIDDRLALQIISDPLQRIILDVLTAVLPPAFFTDNNLVCVVLCRMASISRIHGNSDASSLGYAYLGMVLGPQFGAWRAGYEFGQLGFRLSGNPGLDLFQPRVQMAFAYHVLPYSLPIAQGDALLREAFETANDRGDLTYAGFSSCTMVSSLLFRGQPLAETQQQAETKLNFVTAAKFGLIAEIIATQLRLTRALRGLTQQFPAFDDHDFNEADYEAYLDANPELSIAACWYWIRKLQLRLIGGDFNVAVAAAQRAAPLIWTSGGHLELVEYHFHAGLAKAALCATPYDTPDHLDAIRTHSVELVILAMQCPANFAHRSALLEGELARITGQSLDAQRLYQQAIDLAREHGYLQIEALAHETAARFCMANGLTSAGSSHLAQARELYARYGADARLRQLETMMADAPRAARPALESGAADGHATDTAPLLQIAIALADDIAPDRLIETMMAVVHRSSNATRCLLILPRGDELRLEAESTVRGSVIDVTLHRRLLGDDDAPASIIRQVSTSRRTLQLDELPAAADLASDCYLARARSGSLLCLPLAKRNKLLGLLYLENDAASHAFTAARLDLLTLLASQVAISLENASLEEKESLLKEVHHRVKNNLQLITSLLNLQAARSSDPAVSSMFADSRNRVRSMALVHENLYRAGNLARVSMGPHIRSLCTQLFRSFAIPQQRIAFSPDIDDIQLDLDRAVSCGLLVNELVSNALKHAFPDNAPGTIHVALIYSGDGNLDLSVADDGIGLPAGGVSAHSLGLQLVDDLTHQLRGKLSISTANGTQFTIRFPLNDD